MKTSANDINEISIQYKRQQISERKITSSEDAELIAREVYVLSFLEMKTNRVSLNFENPIQEFVNFL